MTDNNIKPYYRNDFLSLFKGIYFVSVATRRIRGSRTPGIEELRYRAGFASGLSSVALAVGVNPDKFISAEDLELVKMKAEGRL